jgi:isoquinoline 1-oxidoreductase beta subunit
MIHDRNPLVPAGLSRRGFLATAAAAGGGLVVAVVLRVPLGAAEEAAGDAFAPDAFVRIDRDGAVSVVVSQVEMGQGTYTSMPMLVAEELSVDLAKVRVVAAPGDATRYANPALGIQATGGSTSVRGFYEPLRKAGAAARLMLVEAAAQQWGVTPDSCTAAAGTVTHAASGRSLGYGALVDAAAKLPVPQDVPLKDPKDFTLIGTPARRLDTVEKTDGTAVYGIDVRLPGMKIATVAACPVFGGKLGSVDDTAAKAVAGVRQIVRLDDAVAVVADHMGAALKGLAALQITWHEGANADLSTADLVAALKAASEHDGVVAATVGDATAALTAAPRRVDAVYEMPLLAHTTMEPINCTVHVRPDGCDVWVGSQVAAWARQTAAEVTGLPPEAVTVHNQLLGGGFGRRLEFDFITQAVRIARQVDGPLKVVWSREEDVQHDIYRPYYYDRLSAGLDAEGRPTALHHRVTGPSILARWLPPAFQNGIDFDAVDAASGPYAFDNLLVDYVRQEPPEGLLIGWWRGVGVTHNAFVVESFVDELAAAAGSDPVAYRRALLGKEPRALAVLDLAAEKANWGTPLPQGKGRGVSLLFGFGTYVAQVVDLAVAEDGTVRVDKVVCAVDCGVVINPDTVVAQIEGGIVYGLTAALYGEITLAKGRVVQSNFDDYPALRIDEMPTVEVHIVKSGDAPGGLGEPGTSGIAPAVTNAIFAATGKRLRKLPVDPALLKRA